MTGDRAAASSLHAGYLIFWDGTKYVIESQQPCSTLVLAATAAPPPISQELGNQCILALLPSLTTTCPVARGTCLSTHPWLILTLPCTLLGPASWPGSCGWWWGSRRLMSRSRSRSTAAVKPRAAITSLSFNFMASGVVPGPGLCTCAVSAHHCPPVTACRHPRCSSNTHNLQSTMNTLVSSSENDTLFDIMNWKADVHLTSAPLTEHWMDLISQPGHRRQSTSQIAHCTAALETHCATQQHTKLQRCSHGSCTRTAAAAVTEQVSNCHCHCGELWWTV